MPGRKDGERFLPEPLAALKDLAFDLRWTWSHEADALWTRIDPDLWEICHNPWLVLNRASPARLGQLALDGRFLTDLQSLLERRRQYLNRATWFDAGSAAADFGPVAFFCLEFGIGAALPLYAGGLGVLAGDYLKAASDLGAPVTGVGLLYREGYFRQALDADGGQREIHAVNDPASLPIEPVEVDGAPLWVCLELPGRTFRLRVWRASIGRSCLLLLDGADLSNSPADRGITASLYGGDAETRLLQEMVLGVGGWRALEALGQAPQVCHVNEGHAAFSIVERARSLAEHTGLTFTEALWASRPGNVFTTHTPVETGFERFDPDLVRRLLASVMGEEQGSAALDAIIALGRVDGESGSFNTAHLAVRGSGACFAVSDRHQAVSRELLQPLFPRWPTAEVPVSHVTNGVHMPTWDCAAADALWTSTCGKSRWLGPDLGGPETKASDEDVWAMRGAARQTLVGQVRRRLADQLASRGGEPSEVAEAAQVLDPNALTLGFARRFTDYKRPNLLLRDPGRLERLLLDEHRPIQIVLAGKAHPADLEGKAMIREWIALARRPEMRRRVVFLEDYDLGLAQEMVQGADVWINTPRRPWEACGTSGMKVLVNGGLNCSVLDGWWAEAYRPQYGWGIAGTSDGSSDQTDAAEADQLYDLLERRIAPEFYDRGADGVPHAWATRVRASMFDLAPRFNSARMLADYGRLAYAPGGRSIGARAEQGWQGARELAAWRARLDRAWPELHIGEAHFGAEDGVLAVSAPVLLGELRPGDVRVELYADPRPDGDAEIVELSHGDPIPGASNGYVYSAAFASDRPPADYTVRILAGRDAEATRIEAPMIRWGR